MTKCERDGCDREVRYIVVCSYGSHHLCDEHTPAAREIEQGRGALPELPRPTDDELWDQTLKERDAAEDALGRMFQAVTGRPAEWSSAWFFDDAIEEVEDHIAIIEKSQLEVVSNALQRAYILGQRWWQQADSESYKQNKLADDTEAKFRSLQDDTSAAMSACRRMGNRDE